MHLITNMHLGFHDIYFVEKESTIILTKAMVALKSNIALIYYSFAWLMKFVTFLSTIWHMSVYLICEGQGTITSLEYRFTRLAWGLKGVTDPSILGPSEISLLKLFSLESILYTHEQLLERLVLGYLVGHLAMDGWTLVSLIWAFINLQSISTPYRVAGLATLNQVDSYWFYS